MPDLGWIAFDSLGLRVLFVGVLCVLCLAWGATGTARLWDYFTLVTILVVLAIAAVGATVLPLFYFVWELVAFVAWGLGRWAASGHRQTMMGALPLQGFGALGSLGMTIGLLMLALANRSLALRGLAPEEVRLFTFLVLGALVLKSFALLSPAWYPSKDERSFYVVHATLGSAGLLVVGLYPYIRLFADNMWYRSEWREPALWIGMSLALLTALAALGQRDLHKLLALATFSQFAGLIALFAVLSPSDVAIAMLALIAFGLGIAGWSLCLGNAATVAQQRDLRRVGGLFHRMPVTAAFFLACGLSLAGLPPFAGFTGRLFASGTLYARGEGTVANVFLVLSVLTLLYVLRAFRAVFLGPAMSPSAAPRGTSFSMVAVAGALAFGLVVVGLWPEGALAFIRPAIEGSP